MQLSLRKSKIKLYRSIFDKHQLGLWLPVIQIFFRYEKLYLIPSLFFVHMCEYVCVYDLQWCIILFLLFALAME